MRAFLSLPEPLAPAQQAELAAHGVRVADADGDWVRCRTVAEVRSAAARGARLWLVGQEAGGPVGDCTALVLIRAARPTGCPWVAEGLGERAQAACLALGAHAAVLDGPLWGCEGQLDLSGVRSGRDTTLLGEGHGYRVRVLSRGRPEALRLTDGTPDQLSEALLQGRLQPAPQSIGGCGPYRDRPVVEAALALLHAIEERRDEARHHHGLLDDPLGTGAAVVQGPMANVSEAPGLAQAVAAAGGLPFCALGALRPDQATHVLSAHVEALGQRPWGAGVIGFDVMPHRDQHLSAVAEVGRRPVILAGGSVPLAQRVVDMGLDPWLHTPDPALVSQALDAQLPAVVLEGAEAGGHVGALTSLGLWEDALAVIEAGDARPLVVLAGGIGDAVSAAMAGAMAARAHRHGARIALQAGTAFFFTHEIVESGQLPLVYQEAALAAETTELVGASVRLPLRCVPSPYSAEARALERAWLDEHLDRSTRRERMERHNLGRARIAAQARERNPDHSGHPSAPRYRAVPVDRQRSEGAFTMGQGACVSDRLSTVADVVRALTVDAAELLATAPPTEHAIHFRGARTARSTDADTVPIAVVGMGAVLPGAAGVDAYLQLLLRGIDATGPIGDRWDAAHYQGTGRSQSVTRMAGKVDDIGFDPLHFRIPPNVVPTMDRAQRMALVAADEAVRAAGWHLPGAVDRRRAAVVLGNSMGGEHAKSLAVRIRFREVLKALAADPVAKDWDADDLDALQARIEARLAPELPPVDVESMAGLLANVISGRITAWLDWMGGTVVVDAACAASLAAVTVAIDGLRSGRFDAVLTGGVDADLSPETYVGFSRTHALSATGSSPFATGADGFVMAEGAAVLALCRLPDALERGWPVHAVLHGSGVASDGRSKGITAPRAEGQLLALERAWTEAGIGPDDLGAIEAHGTGTSVGDRTEIGGLARRMGRADHPVWVSSVKSNLGHLKGGAGAAGLVKAALSAGLGVAFPSLHAGPVIAEVRRPLAVPRAAAPLHAPYVGVSAFGFGGTDYHVVVGPPPENAAARRPLAIDRGPAPWSSEPVPLVLCYAADDLETLASAIDADQPCPLDADALHRVALLTQPHTRGRDLAQVSRWLRSGPRPGDALGRLAVYGLGEARPLTLAFPGQGAQRIGGVDAAALHWPAREALLALGEPAGKSLAAWEREGGALGIHVALFATGIAWSRVLGDAGVPVAATVGHSLGAFPSLVAAGRLSAASALPLVVARGVALDACPDGAMLAVALPADEAADAAKAMGLALAAVNGPTATVLSGPVPQIEEAERTLTDAKPQRIDVPRAYHSPSVEPAARALAEAAAATSFGPGDVPVWSTRLAAPMPPDPVDDLARAIVDPVRFDDTVSAMLDAGLGPFVECGPGGILSRLIRARGGISIPLDSRLGGYPMAAAALWTLGHPQLLVGAPGTVLRRGLPAVPPRAWPAPADGDVVAEARVAAVEAVEIPVPPAPADEVVLADDARGLVIQAICEVTGYPADFVASGQDLEADLGVDSIRKMEVLGHLERSLGVKASDADLQLLADADLADLTAWVEARRNQVSDPVVAAEASPVVFAIPSDGPLPPGAPLVPAASPSETLAWLQAHAAGLSAAPRGADPVQQALIDGWCRAAAAEGVDVPVRGVTPVALEPCGDASLPEAPVVLATGGLTGIVRPCLDALIAATGARVVVLGRRDLEAPDGWTYLRCDLTDERSVAATVAHVEATLGAIDVVVHGAGALADGPALDRTDADRTRVLGAKLDGARNLARALSQPVHSWVDMSSITGWFANPHQSLYAAANRALAAEERPAARQLTIGWTAWSEVGMAADERLQRLLRARGLVSLAPDEGAAAFVRLLRSEVEGPVLVTRGAPSETDDELLGSRLAWRSDHARWRLPLDPAHPSLADHVVAGRPLVPAATWGAALLAAARVFRPDTTSSLSGFSIVGPCVVSSPRHDVTLSLRARGRSLEARIGTDEVVFATASLEPSTAAGEATDAPEPLSTPQPVPYQPDKLFHGPSWRVLSGIVTDADGAEGDVRPTNGLPRSAELIDAAFQLACAWADQTHGFLALPVGAKALDWYGPADGPIRLRLAPRTDGERVFADLVAHDADGVVRLVGRDLELRRATSKGSAR